MSRRSPSRVLSVSAEAGNGAPRCRNRLASFYIFGEHPIRRVREPRESDMSGSKVLVAGLSLGESPRWHDDRLWISDMGTHDVVAVDLNGASEIVAHVPGMPMGLGWLPDGDLLVVSSRDGLLRRGPDGALRTFADLTGLATHPWSDMVVDGRGNAYVGNIGFDFGS